MPYPPIPVAEAVHDIGAMSEFCAALPAIVRALTPSDRAACLMRRQAVDHDIVYLHPAADGVSRPQPIDVRALARHLDAQARGVPLPGFEPTAPAPADLMGE